MHPKARLAINEDVEEIIGLWKSFMLEDDSTQEDIAEVSHRWAERLGRQIHKAQVMVVELSNRTVGFMGLIDSTEASFVPKDIAYFSDIFVLPEARRLGAASQLLRSSKEHSKGIYKELWLNTHKENFRMQRLLRKHGYKEHESFSIEGLEDYLFYRRCV